MDAALPMRTTFSALTCGFANDNNDDIITDPNLIEESESDTLITYIIDRQGNLLCSHTSGLFTHEQVYSRHMLLLLLLLLLCLVVVVIVFMLLLLLLLLLCLVH